MTSQQRSSLCISLGKHSENFRCVGGVQHRSAEVLVDDATSQRGENLKVCVVAIFAADIPVRDKDRFAHLPLVTAQVKNAIKDAAKIIAEAEALVSAKG